MGVSHTSFRKPPVIGSLQDCLVFSSLSKVTNTVMGEGCQKEDCDFAMNSALSKDYPQNTDALILELLRKATVRI